MVERRRGPSPLERARAIMAEIDERASPVVDPAGFKSCLFVNRSFRGREFTVEIDLSGKPIQAGVTMPRPVRSLVSDDGRIKVALWMSGAARSMVAEVDGREHLVEGEVTLAHLQGIFAGPDAVTVYRLWRLIRED